MENEKSMLNLSIKRLENELGLAELSEENIVRKISHFKSVSLRTNMNLQNISWKVSQADFIHCCENEKHRNSLHRIERSSVIIRNSEVPNNSEQRCENHMTVRELSEKLEHIHKINSKKKQSISITEQRIKTLKERNNEIMQKLKNDLEYWENEEKRLEDILEQIPIYPEDEENSFDYYNEANI